MSRIADAYERTGRRLPGEGRRWDAESEAVARHMREADSQIPNPQSPIPNPKSLTPTSASAKASADAPERLRREGGPNAIDFELASAIRRIFLAPESVVRSVLFCTPPGDPRSDVAWSVAELLASQSGQRVALVADGRTLPAHANGTHSLVTCIGWYEPVTHAPSETGEAPSSDVPGARVCDRYPSFDYVIVSATAQRLEELCPLSREVDGVIVVVSAGETRKDIAAQLVETLRGANLLGTILAT